MVLKLNPITGSLDLVGTDGGGGGDPTDLTGDAGGKVTGGAGDNINVIGDATQAFIQTTGTPASNKIEWKLIEPAEDGELLIGHTANSEPSVATLTAGTGISITNGAGAITITSTVGDALSVPTDSGTAASAAGSLSIVGGTGVDTAGSGSTVTINAAAAVPTSFTTDSGTGTPVGNSLAVNGGTGINTSGAGAGITINMDTPVTVANGGTARASHTAYALIAGGTTATGAQQSIASVGTSPQLLQSNGAGALPTFEDPPAPESLTTALTAGSIVFSDGTNLAEDNANLFWDDTNNRQGIGIATPLEDLHIVGTERIVHTATGASEHGLQVISDGAANGDTHAVDVVLDVGVLTAACDDAALMVSIDQDTAVGGKISALEVLPTAGSATVYGLEAGPSVNPVLHLQGTYGDMDSALVNATNRLTEFTARGSDIAMFVANSDTVTIGDAAEFQMIEFILATVADGVGVQPTFEYSTGAGTWATFCPIDGTNGFRNTGVIGWIDSDIPSWAVGAGGEYLIRITRNSATLATVPIEDLVQISAVTEHKWDSSGDLTVNSVTLQVALGIPSGGTGVTTWTPYAVVTGGTTATGALQQVSGVGTSGQVLTSNGASALPTWQGAGGFSWVEVTGTTQAMAVDTGYVANNAALVTLTLPTTAVFGSILRIAGKGAGGWLLAQNSSEIVHFGVLDSTTGVGGSLASSQQYDTVHLVCTVADTEWTVLSSVGNITVV